MCASVLFLYVVFVARSMVMIEKASKHVEVVFYEKDTITMSHGDRSAEPRVAFPTAANDGRAMSFSAGRFLPFVIRYKKLSG